MALLADSLLADSLLADSLPADSLPAAAEGGVLLVGNLPAVEGGVLLADSLLADSLPAALLQVVVVGDLPVDNLQAEVGGLPDMAHLPATATRNTVSTHSLRQLTAHQQR